MKIQLHNFKCWKDKSIDFQQEGIILLSGKSGAGKTSILDAIIFALFGIGNKLIMNGKSSCKVVFEFDDLKIIRTKRPNRLVVNETYEDAAGQVLIDKKFSTNFHLTGYIKQNSYKSFLLLSPLEKLLYLEKFAFQDLPLLEYKKKTKELIKSREKDYVSVTSKLEMTNNYLLETSEPELITFPIKCKNQEKAAKNHTIKIKNNQKKLSHTEKGIDIFKDKIAATIQLENNLNSKKTEQQRIMSRLDELNTYKTVDIKQKKESLANLKHDLNLYLSAKKDRIEYDSYLKSSEEYTNYYNKEKETLETRLAKLQKNLWKEETNEETQENIKIHTEFIDGLIKMESNNDRISKLQEKINSNKYKKELQETQKKLQDVEDKIDSKNVYECPNCEQSLKFVDDTLVCCDRVEKSSETSVSKLEKKQKKYKERIQKLERRNQEYQKYEYEIKILQEQNKTFSEDYELEGDEVVDELKSELNDMKKYLNKNLSRESEIKEIQSKIDSDSLSELLVDMKQKLDLSEQRFKDYSQDSPSDSVDEETLRNNISELEKEINTVSIYLQEIERLTNKLENYTTEIETLNTSFIEKYKTIKPLSELNERLVTYNDKLTQLKQEKHVLEEIQHKLDRYNVYKQRIDEYNTWRDKQKNLEDKEVDIKKRLNSSKKLKEKICDSESLAITNLINQINTGVQPYLDTFFEEDPISIELLSFKEDKKKNIKSQINVKIEYKGMECDISMLSGGELQRVIVAFNLALCEMFNLPCILLDECTSNLDQETTQLIVKGVKEHFSHRHVVMIAHQVVSGLFDRVIEINE